MGTYREDVAAKAEARQDPEVPSPNGTQSLIQQKYFAAMPTAQIGNAIFDRVYQWFDFAQQTAHFARIQKAYQLYYGFAKGATSSGVAQAGPQGQYSLVYINEYRNTIKHVINMIASEKIAFDCKGRNTDVETTESCEIGNIILSDAEEKLGIDAKLKSALEYSCALSEGWVSTEWNKSAGRLWIPDQAGNHNWEGDVNLTVSAPWDVVRDIWSKGDDSNWVIRFRNVNKYDLAAVHPELAERIVHHSSNESWIFREFYFNQHLVGDLCDTVVEITLLHKPTPAIPLGRKVVLLASDLILSDEELGDEILPIVRVAPDKIIESPMAYTFAFDLLGIQDMQNLCDSIVATIFKAFGVGLIKLPVGHNMDYQQVFEGLAALVVNETNGKVESLNFAKLPEGISTLRSFLSSRQDIVAGINSVIRGQPDSNIKAGNFAALIASQAYQFMNSIQASYTSAGKAVGSQIINLYKKNAKNERIAKMSGINKNYAVKSFVGDKLKAIESVNVDVSSSATRSIPARLNLIDVLTSKGAIQSTDDIISVLNTGNVQHATERKETEQDGIDTENEMLRAGGNPPVLPTDNPFKHVQAHLMIVDDPEIRASQPQVVKAVMDHCLMHVDNWQKITMSNVSLLQLMNVAPAQLPQMGMPLPGGPVPGAPEGKPGEATPKAAAAENTPQLPKNPLTGAPPPVNAGPLGGPQ